MKSDKVFKDIVEQHESAMKLFKDGYSFYTKQKDILHYIEVSLRKYQAEQLTDQNKVAALNKKIEKRQFLIDDLIQQLEITKGVTELDITYGRK